MADSHERVADWWDTADTIWHLRPVGLSNHTVGTGQAQFAVRVPESPLACSDRVSDGLKRGCHDRGQQ